MPTIKRIGPYRFFFYSGDAHEPPHVHVERDKNTAKFWLDPIRLVYSGGFNRKEINRLHNIVMEHQKEFMEEWNDFFSS